MIQNEPNEELRTVSATLYASNGDLLPAATVWSAGMVKISKAGGPFVDTVNLPVAVAGGGDGAFDLVLTVEEVDTVGMVRVRFYSSPGGALIAEYTAMVEAVPAPPAPLPPVTGSNPIVKSDVLAIAPELVSVHDDAWVDILNYVNNMSIKAIRDPYTFRLARIFLAAHYGTVSKRAYTGAAGPVVSEAAGGLRRAYGLVALSSADAALGQTMYGMQYLGLLRSSNAAGPFLV